MMTLRVYLHQKPGDMAENSGIGRVVYAQWRYLPQYDIELVADYRKADVIAAHANATKLPQVDVLHCHGLYWTGDHLSGTYNKWCHEVNKRIIHDARRALRITVPSPWVAKPFQRDMRINPRVIGHGLDLAAWQPVKHHNTHVLWNKNRNTDVCDATPANELAKRGIPVVSTFAPLGTTPANKLTVIGKQSESDMRQAIQQSGVYLATTKETFGIGTLEAMACGVPVLGYRHGGTANLIEHGITGWLVEPDDYDGLVDGYARLMLHREHYRTACLEAVQRYDWSQVMQQYADLYHIVANQRATNEPSVAVVITSYNYGKYVGDAIESALNQVHKPDDIIVVDDGSTDNTAEVVRRYPVTYLRQNNHGVAAARNYGIAHADAEYIVSLDGDDRLDPAFIATLLPAMQDRALGVAYSGLGIINGSGLRRSRWPGPFTWTTQAAGGIPPANCIPSACLFRRSMWSRAGGYRQDYAPGEDAEFWTRGLSIGFTARQVTQNPLFHYRLHEDSAHRTKPYVAIDPWLPWIRDGDYPMAAPADAAPLVRSYSEPVITVIIQHDMAAVLDRLIGQSLREWQAIVVMSDGLIPEPYTFIETAKTYEETTALARGYLTIDGTRETLPDSDALTRYAQEQINMGCCGKGKQAAKAQRAAGLISPQERRMTDSTNSNLVRMEFIGNARGRQTFRGAPSRTVYQGGNNNVNRFTDVKPEDVAHLEALQGGRLWRRVQRFEAPPAPASESSTGTNATEADVVENAELVKALAGISEEPVPFESEATEVQDANDPASTEAAPDAETAKRRSRRKR